MASNRPAICTTKTDLMPHLKEECTAEEVPSTVQSAAVQTFLGMAWQIMCGLTQHFVLQAVLKDKQDETSIRLVFANQTEEDILLRPELDAFALDPRFEIHYVLSRPKHPKEWICGSTGRCDSLRAHTTLDFALAFRLPMSLDVQEGIGGSA